MKYKYNQKLPKKIEDKLDAYIKRIKAIKWFKLSPDFSKKETNKQVKVILKAFGIKAVIEYKSLKTQNDWDAARVAARDAARDAAWGAVWDAAWGWDAAWVAARDAVWDAARNAARDAAWVAAWDAAWGATDILALNSDDYKKKYPNGSFINLIPLWEQGLYPIGVVDGKFIIYVPEK